MHALYFCCETLEIQNKYLGAQDTMWQSVKMLFYMISGQDDGEIVVSR